MIIHQLLYSPPVCSWGRYGVSVPEKTGRGHRSCEAQGQQLLEGLGHLPDSTSVSEGEKPRVHASF